MPSVEFNLGGTLKFLVEEDWYSVVTLHYRDFTVTARGTDMAFTLPVDNATKVHVAYVDAHGNPAKVDGDVTWGSSDPTILEVAVDTADSSNATVQALGKVGGAQVTATADADLGAGVRELVTLMAVDVVAGEAVAGTISPVGDIMPPTATPTRK